ncbi:hypothetical protein GCM10008959_05640 [Deinococcus seoulensis]|uniref:Secreted protein n=1 Tax=Deinococcus seoulensis TaxID=1837379 RepID=A0ABQ2RLM0_9DEIO|nr:hypothetical protein GCM10008959_05640 [Deinococcus seoulensis]
MSGQWAGRLTRCRCTLQGQKQGAKVTADAPCFLLFLFSTAHSPVQRQSPAGTVTVCVLVKRLLAVLASGKYAPKFTRAA